MKKSTWVIEIEAEVFIADSNKADLFYCWSIHNRLKPSIKFEGTKTYTRRSSALRGARRIAKALRISAEVDQ